MLKKKKEKKNLTSQLTDLKISHEFNQREKATRWLPINYAMNFSYGSYTVTLVSLCVPFGSQKNKQKQFKNECR